MPHPVQLTSRDEQLLLLVAAYRAVTIAQLRRRFFPTSGARSACYTRIQRLVQTEYLAARRLPSQSGVGSGKTLLTLGPLGRRVVATLSGCSRMELGRASRLVAPLVISHHLATGDVRLSLELAVARSRRFTVLAWTPEHALAAAPLGVTDPQTGQTIAWVPDGAFTLVLADGRHQRFFLELDRGTIPGKRLRTKLRGYLLRQPATPVLFVVPDPMRQVAIHAWTAAEAKQLAADPTVVWLAELAHVREETVLEQAIWQVAGGPDRIALEELVTTLRPGTLVTVATVEKAGRS